MFMTITLEEQKRVGRRIRDARRAKGLKQAELARELGLSDARTIRNYESGVRIPAYEIMDGIARITGKPREWFFDEDRSAPGMREEIEALRAEIAEFREDLRRFLRRQDDGQATQ